MIMRFRAFTLVLLAAAILGAPAMAAPEVEAVLKLMPADFPVSAVVVDFEKLEKGIQGFGKAVDPTSTPSGPLADLKDELGIASWIDFTKPVGLAQPSFQGGQPVLWATAPNLKDKFKTVPDAKEEEGGIWFLPFEGKEDLFVIQKGDLVIAARDKTLLESALNKEGRTLADELRGRLGLLTGRDVFVHLNFEPIRPMAQQAIAQASQMAPMFAMMAAQQGGGDPAAVTAVFTGVIDAAKNFVEQVTYVDVTLGITEEAATATIATGFKDGPIQKYLAKNKPAATPLLSTLEDQPFTMAMGWQVPGEESPFFTYFFDKMAAGPGGAPAGEGSASAEGAALARDLFKKVEGMNMAMHMSKDGMTTAGDYVGKDAQGIFELAKKSMVKESPLAALMSSGIAYEPADSKTLNGKSVETFSIKIDETNPASAGAVQMFGPNRTLYMAPMEGRVGFYMGPETGAEKFFSGKVSKPLTNNTLVADSLKKLPPQRSLVILVDPAGILPALGPLMGAQIPENIPAGPPVAISTSLFGEYARTDVYVPAKAISRVIEATKTPPPM